MKRSPQARGNILAMTLIVLTLLLMTAGAFLLSGTSAGFLGAEDHRATQRQALAKSAANRLIHLLEEDPASTSDVSWVSARGSESYEITFDTSRAQYSVNNLQGTAPQNSSTAGVPVPTGQAEIIVRTRTGSTLASYRFMLGRGFSTFSAVGANGAVRLGETVSLNSITSLADSTPATFNLVSNSAPDGITYNTGSSSSGVSVSPDCHVISAGQISPVVQTAVGSSSRWQENSPPRILPELPVDAVVSQKSGLPAPSTGPGGQLFIANDRYAPSDLVVDGSVTLGNASLYVEGDLTINGGIDGNGSIYVRGDVIVRGGNASVSTNAQTGAALFSGGNVTFEGASASGLLDSLALSDPGLAQAWSEFQAGYNMMGTVAAIPSASYTRPLNFEAVFGNTPAWIDLDGIPPADQHISAKLFAQYPQVRDLFWAKHVLGPGRHPHTNRRLLEKAGPNGDRSYFGTESFSRDMIDRIEALPGFGTDPRLSQLTKAFDEIGYNFRHDWISNAPVNRWDSPFPNHSFQEISFDQTAWIVFGFPLPPIAQGIGAIPTPFVYDGPLRGNQEAARAKYVELLTQNPPLDFSWLGKSYFQGVVYARGNITLQNHSTIIGGIIAGGELNLEDGVEFTFNKEYEDLTQNLTGPLRATSFSQL